MTSLAEERREQERWRPLRRDPLYAHFDRVLENEFLPREEQESRIAARLARMVAFAAEHVPYYRDLFASLKLSPAVIAGPQSLPLLPELDKAAIRREDARLCPPALPPGEAAAGFNKSSGSTGVPTRIFRSQHSRLMDLVFEQRQLRWYRFDPMGSTASIRMAKDLPHVRPGVLLAVGQTVTLKGWPYLNRWFATGPFAGFADTNPLAAKLAWLERHKPNYLRISSGALEHLAFAFEGDARRIEMRGLRAAAEPMTPGMEARIEKTFGVPVNISFGMDEVGWIATRCGAGRYHVHAERFIVEIVDESGKPVSPGDFGRVLITDIGNFAMPLIRYVTDDVARAAAAPCPCGRTLPVMGEVIGRYSQMSGLPEGTMDLVWALRRAMEELPPELAKPLRAYQIRQTASGDFKLHLVTAGPLAAGFAAYAEEHWRRALAARDSAGAAPAFSLREVTAIPLAPSGKFFHFVSEIARPREGKDYAGRAAKEPRS